MEYRIIKSPSSAAKNIILARSGTKYEQAELRSDSLGLVQGRMIDMVVAADIAQKQVNVTVFDVKGSCPQNMILLAILGDTASVESAINSIKSGLEEYKC